jgi:hypothetical protein
MGYMVMHDCVVVNNESERMRKKVVAACFKTLLAFAWRE